MEALAMLEDIEGECHFKALSLVLYLEQRTFQVEPEADLLQGGAAGGVSVQLGHLEREREREKGLSMAVLVRQYEGKRCS